jgi:hypothetical protein
MFQLLSVINSFIFKIKFLKLKIKWKCELRQNRFFFVEYIYFWGDHVTRIYWIVSFFLIKNMENQQDRQTGNFDWGYKAFKLIIARSFMF